MVDKLKELLDKQNQAAQSDDGKVDWSARKRQWLDGLDGLFTIVTQWITEAGGPKPGRDQLSRSEKHIGQYMAPTLRLNVGSDVIFMEPKGTLIIGGQGRVDVYAGSRPEKRVLLIFDPAKGWQIGVKVPRPRLTPLDRDSFTQILEELVR